MMDAPMKLLVYAIATAMIISLLYIFVFPLAFPPQNSIAMIERNLTASETGLGKGFFVEIIAGQGNGFMGETFDSSARNAIFRCNSASQCCPQGEECNLAIEWNDRMAKFNKGTAVTVTTRCKRELGLYLCTIYFGEKPAQIEIDSLGSLPESVDLGKESLSFEVAFSNKGEQEAFETEVSAEIFRRYLVQGSWVEKKVENASKAYSFGGLKHGETRAERIIVPLNENGDFKAKIRASGLEAGFDERIVEFSATGAIGQCYALYCDQPRLIEGKCAARCYCENCLYGGACAEKILQSDNITLGLGPEISLQNAEAEILGSDIVGFTLENRHCN